MTDLPPEANELGNIIKEYKAKGYGEPIIFVGIGLIMAVGGVISGLTSSDGGMGIGLVYWAWSSCWSTSSISLARTADARLV